MAVGRNELCYCGSNKKYKKCCLVLDEIKAEYGILTESEPESTELITVRHDVGN